MLLHYTKTASRYLLRNKLYSFINIGGLAISLAVATLVLLFVLDELSYDRWLPNIDRVYRLETTFYPPGRGILEFASTMGPVRDALERDFPNEIEAAARIGRQGATVSIDDQRFNETVNYVDPGFFDILELEAVSGDPEAALQQATSLVITESIAQKYFGSEPALNRTVTFDNNISYRIGAVIRDIPDNSHLDMTLIARLERERLANPGVIDTWAGVFFHTYVKLREGVAAAALRDALPDFFRRNATTEVPGLGDVALSDITELRLIPVTDIHLKSERRGNMKPGGNINTVYAFSAIALLIIVIASINFMNLSTARSSIRAKEVALRKVVGAERSKLIIQFQAESVFLAVLALIAALILARLILPYYNNFLSRDFSLNFLENMPLAAFLAALAILVGLVGGLYPAFYLSAFRPGEILKSNQSSTDSSQKFRFFLVLVQFSISIALITATAIVGLQTRYAGMIDLGFNKDLMVVLAGLGRTQASQSSDTIKQEIEKLPGVISVTRSSSVPPIIGSPNNIIELPENPGGESLIVEQVTVDFDYFDTYGMEPVTGRLFSQDRAADLLIVPEAEEEIPTQAVVINESAVKRLGYVSPELALGRTFRALIPGDRPQALTEVIGVIPDAHFHSIHVDIPPMMFVVREEGFGAMTVHIRPEGLDATLAGLDRIWQSAAPDEPVARSFIDDNFSALYNGEKQMQQVFMYLAGFAVFVACLGLLGLAGFTAERRTKEIGMRKVLGASVLKIVRLLLWQFSKPVLIANLIAWPLAFYFLDQWLERFSYRIEMTIVPFLAAGLIALLLAWATVAGHAIIAARRNPVHSLRYE